MVGGRGRRVCATGAGCAGREVTHAVSDPSIPQQRRRGGHVACVIRDARIRVPCHIPVRIALQRVALLCGRPESPADEPGCPPSRPSSSCVNAQPRSGRRPGSPRDLRQPGRPDPGEPRAPTATCCPPTEAPSTSSPRFRSRLLACAAPLLAAMEGDARHRPARDRHPLASRGLQAVLALEVAAPRWTTKHNGRDPGSRSPDGRRESDVGCAAHPRRDPEARS